MLKIDDIISQAISAPEKPANLPAIKSPPQLPAHEQQIESARITARHAIVTELLPVATRTLKDVMSDKFAAPAARVSAARTVLEYGIGPSDTLDDSKKKPLSEMTAAEIERTIEELREIKSISSAIETEYVEIEPS